MSKVIKIEDKNINPNNAKVKNFKFFLINIRLIIKKNKIKRTRAVLSPEKKSSSKKIKIIKYLNTYNIYY